MDDTIEERFARYKNWTVGAMFIFFIAVGAIGVRYANDPEAMGLQHQDILQWAMAFALALLVLIWCLLDAQERGHNVPAPMQAAIVLMVIIGFPFYLFSTREPGERGRAFGLALALLVCMLTTYLISAIVTAKILGVTIE